MTISKIPRNHVTPSTMLLPPSFPLHPRFNLFLYITYQHDLDLKVRFRFKLRTQFKLRFRFQTFKYSIYTHNSLTVIITKHCPVGQ